MDYKLNPEIGKIASKVRIIWNGEAGNRADRLIKIAQPQTWKFENGSQTCEAVFDKKLNVLEYRAMDSRIDISVYEFCEMNPKR